MIAVNGKALSDQPVFMNGRRAQSIYTAGVKAYPDKGGCSAGKTALEAILAEAGGIDRYLYTAATVSAFDAAFSYAQGVFGDPGAAQADAEAAASALSQAMSGLTGVTFANDPASMTIHRMNGIAPTKLQITVTYDGIGAVTYASSNNIIATVSDTGLVTGMLSTGSAVITISAPSLADLITNVTVKP